MKSSLKRKTVKKRKDVRYILENLREEDKLEAIEQAGENYIEECLDSIIKSDTSHFVIGYDGKTPVCMGGCVETDTKGVGVVWFLCTPEIIKHKNCILRNIKYEVEKYSKKYWMLCNSIYCKNTLAKVWLKKLGFKFNNPFGAKISKNFEFFYKTNSRGLKP